MDHLYLQRCMHTPTQIKFRRRKGDKWPSGSHVFFMNWRRLFIDYTNVTNITTMVFENVRSSFSRHLCMVLYGHEGYGVGMAYARKTLHKPYLPHLR